MIKNIESLKNGRHESEKKASEKGEIYGVREENNRGLCSKHITDAYELVKPFYTKEY